MARARGSPSASRSSPARAPAPQPAKPAAQPHTNNTSSAHPQQQQPAAHPAHNSAAVQPPTNVYIQRGGGAGSGMLGTMAAVAGGSVLGHGISNYLYGGSNQAPTQPAEAQELAKSAAQDNNVCAPQLGGYSKCLESNPDSAESCRWAWDYFLQCRDANPQQ